MPMSLNAEELKKYQSKEDDTRHTHSKLNELIQQQGGHRRRCQILKKIDIYG